MKTLVQKEALPQRSFYTEELLHSQAFTTGFCKEGFVEISLDTKKVFEQNNFYTEASTHRRLYTQKLLHPEAFTHTNFYTEKHFYRAILH